jgi:rhomboid protease GluP
MNLLRRLPEAPMTLLLIVANLLVFGVMAVTSGHVPIGAFGNETLVDAGASIGVPGWRWITAAFIHVNALHIFMNMWVLAQIGVLAERAVGRGLFLASYVVTGAAGNVLGTILSLTHVGPRHVSAGASGAIMGLFGIAAVFAWRTGQRPIATLLAKNVLFVLVIGVAVTAGGAIAVDNAAHIGGLVVGAAIGLARARWPLPAPRWATALFVGGSVALTLAAFTAVLFAGA